MSDPAIRIRGLVKRFEGVAAVDGVDLEVRAGECFGILGPNGAGKTTTIEILEGLKQPTAGAVELFGLPWRGHERELRSRIGIALQETELYDKLSVRETVALFRSFYPRRLEVDDALAQVDLIEKKAAWVEKLSGGQKQRLAIACALVCDPELFFLDEPTTGLDPAARRSLWEIIGKLRARGRTIVLTTHYMEEAEKLCDRIAILQKGKVIALGTPRELIARLGGDEIIEVGSDPAVAAEVFAALPGVAACLPDAGGFRLSVRGIHETLPRVIDALRQNGARPSRLATRTATLDDVFVKLTGTSIGAEEAKAAEAAQAVAQSAGARVKSARRDKGEATR
ncbi:MAG: ABC transporter ATP-binding protein [Planctomycetes bacterium]|nr:ABC transporter ATP-binding protein [Planctomycetota bacterium]